MLFYDIYYFTILQNFPDLLLAHLSKIAKHWDSSLSHCRWSERDSEVWSVSVHYLEGGHVMHRIHTIVEDKLGSGKVSDPIIILSIDKELEVLFYLLICAFSLPI